MARQVEVAVVGHVDEGGRIGGAAVAHGELHGTAVRAAELEAGGEGARARQAELACVHAAGEAHRLGVLIEAGLPQALVQAALEVRVQVVPLVGAIVTGQLAHGAAQRDLSCVGAVGRRPDGGAVARGVVEVALDAAEAEQDVLNAPLRIGHLDAEQRGAEIAHAHAGGPAGELVHVRRMPVWCRAKGRGCSHDASRAAMPPSIAKGLLSVLHVIVLSPSCHDGIYFLGDR